MPAIRYRLLLKTKLAASQVLGKAPVKSGLVLGVGFPSAPAGEIVTASLLVSFFWSMSPSEIRVAFERQFALIQQFFARVDFEQVIVRREVGETECACRIRIRDQHRFAAFFGKVQLGGLTCGALRHHRLLLGAGLRAGHRSGRRRGRLRRSRHHPDKPANGESALRLGTRQRLGDQPKRTAHSNGKESSDFPHACASLPKL